MKKTTTMLLALMIAAGATWAQRPLHERNTTHQQRMEQIRGHRSLGQGHSSFSLKSRSAQQNAAKPTQTQSRLKAYVYSEHNGTQMEPYDSLVLYWKGTHHTDDIVGDLLEGDLYLSWFSIDLFYPRVNGEGISGYPAYNPIKGIDSFDYYEWFGSRYDLTSKMPCVLDGDDKMLSYTWRDSIGSGWENNYRMNYTYNAAGNITRITRQNWSGSVWENHERVSYTYDSQGNITQETYEDWDNPSSAWAGDWQGLYEYDGQGHLTRRIVQVWSGAWQNKYRDSYTYTNDERTEEISEDWNGTQWDLVHKTEYTYNASGMRIKDISSDWDGSAWEYWRKFSYQYDNDGNRVKEVGEIWDGTQWGYDYVYSFDYGNDVLNSISTQEWDNTSASLENNSRMLFTYNTYKQCTGVAVEAWDGSQWGYSKYIPELAFYYEEFDDGTDDDDDDDTGIHAASQKSLKLYPNPASDKLTVQLTAGTMNHIQITNAAGQVVFDSKAPMNAHQVTLPVNQLAPGVYYLQVQSGAATATKPFVVQ